MDKLNTMCQALLGLGFSKGDFCCIHRHQDLGFHVIFTSGIKLNNRHKEMLNIHGFTYSINIALGDKAEK